MSIRHKQKKHFPTIIVILISGGLLLIVVALFFSLQNKNASGTPVLSVDQQQIDYGDVKFDTQKTFTIRVTNRGDGVLRFKEKPTIQVMEGC